MTPTPKSWEDEFNSAFNWVNKDQEVARWKAIYGFGPDDIKEFILKTLKEQKEAMIEKVEGLDVSTMTYGGFRRAVLALLKS